jgi:molybdate transport system substrate-binding protein
VNVRRRFAQVVVSTSCVAVGIGLATLVVACGGPSLTAAPSASVAAGSPAAGSSPSVGGGSVVLTVFAAASLKDAFGSIARAYPTSHPGVALTLSFDSSSTLRAQIEQGAPADAFASADEANAQRLVDAGLTAGPASAFAGNLLAIVVPASNPALLGSWMDLARPGVRIIAAGLEVPISAYADRLTANLAGLPGAPAGFAAAVGANVVSREQDVRSLLAKVELGEGDAGIVYTTDAASSTKVSTLAIPPPANVAATYDAVAIKASAHPAEAAAFVGWLSGPDAAAILERFGFRPPG